MAHLMVFRTTAGLSGRVRVASEGINATVGGCSSAVDLYIIAMKIHPLFHLIEQDFKTGHFTTKLEGGFLLRKILICCCSRDG